jgi:hypothetical protein
VVRRAEAAFTTALIVVVMGAIVAWLVGTALPVDQFMRAAGVNAGVADACAGFFVFGIPVAWMLFDGALRRATYGMRKRNLIFRKGEGQDITFWPCCARILVGILLLPVIPVSAVLAVFDARHRTAADLLCGTGVYMRPDGETGRCTKCGYDLRGLPAPRCPECGAPFAPAANSKRGKS